MKHLGRLGAPTGELGVPAAKHRARPQRDTSVGRGEGARGKATHRADGAAARWDRMATGAGDGVVTGHERGTREAKPHTAARANTGDVTLQRDLNPVLADLSDLSNLLEEEARQRAREILDHLEEFQPSASSLSGVMELAMADGVAPKAGEEVENRQGERCEDCGQWLDANGVCHECRGAEDAGRNGFNPDSAAKQAAEIGKAKAALRDCIENKADHHDAGYRGDIGFISFLYGQEQDDANGKAYGLSHLSFKHGDDGIIDRFADVLIRGRAKKVAHNRIRIDKGQCTIYLCKILSRKNWGYTNHERWVMTAFTQDPDWGKKEKKGGA